MDGLNRHVPRPSCGAHAAHRYADLTTSKAPSGTVLEGISLPRRVNLMDEMNRLSRALRHRVRYP